MLVDCEKSHPERVHFKFLLASLRFICGCLNRRTNGTICFGVGDEKGKKYMDGEIAGIGIDLNSIDLYTETLKNGILECFHKDTADIVKNCVSDPIFVKVKSHGENEVRYVIEVDVEASFKFCKNLVFKVNLYKIFDCLYNKGKLDDQSIEELKKSFKPEDKYTYYVRRGSTTMKILDKDIFIKRELPDLVVSRIVFEIRESNFTPSDQFYEALKRIKKQYHSNNFSSVFIRDILKSLKGYRNEDMEKRVQVVKKVLSQFTKIDENIKINENYQKRKQCIDEHNEQYITQNPRGFLNCPDNEKYIKGLTLSQPSDEKRLTEFKYFDEGLTNSKKINDFVNAVNKFSNECLNRGTIGTIYFGVAGYSPPESFKPLEIIGHIIDENGYDRRAMYTDKLRYAIQTSFSNATADIALKCISNPKFVKVEIPGENRCRYVIEVDVEPLFVFCKTFYFLVDLNFDVEKNNNLKRKKKYDIFGEEGLSPKQLENIRKDLKKIKINGQKVKEKLSTVQATQIPYLRRCELHVPLFLLLVVVSVHVLYNCTLHKERRKVPRIGAANLVDNREGGR